VYLTIEEEFKKKSWLRLSQLAFFGIYFLLAIPFGWFFVKYADRNLWLWILLYVVVFYVGVYIFIIAKVHKSKDFFGRMSWISILI